MKKIEILAGGQPRGQPTKFTIVIDRPQYSIPQLYVPKKGGKPTLAPKKYWYLWYTFRRPVTGKMEKQIAYCHLNSYKTVAERVKHGKAWTKAMAAQNANIPEIFKSKKSPVFRAFSHLSKLSVINANCVNFAGRIMYFPLSRIIRKISFLLVNISFSSWESFANWSIGTASDLCFLNQQLGCSTSVEPSFSVSKIYDISESFGLIIVHWYNGPFGLRVTCFSFATSSSFPT